MKIIFVKKISSTEDYIRKLLKKLIKTREDTAVIASVQTKGKGTKGRAFSSNIGGVYLSFVKFYDKFPAKDAFKINQKISVAVVKTLRAFNVRAKIKWPNDIYAENKKICGMLINNSLSEKYVDYTVCGIGVNVNNGIPDELKDIAISVNEITGTKADLKSFVFTLLYNIENTEEVGLYARYSMIFGRKIKVCPLNGEPFIATAEKVSDDGRLLLSDGRALCAEEVSLKF